MLEGERYEVDACGQTPAFYAAREGHVAVLSVLDEYGVPFQRPDAAGELAEHYAAWSQHVLIAFRIVIL